MPASVRILRSSSSAARATPTAIAATIGRVLSKVSMTPAKPFSTLMSGLPSRLSFGMRTLSNRMAAVSEALIPSLFSSRSTVTPG